MIVFGAAGLHLEGAGFDGVKPLYRLVDLFEALDPVEVAFGDAGGIADFSVDHDVGVLLGLLEAVDPLYAFVAFDEAGAPQYELTRLTVRGVKDFRAGLG